METPARTRHRLLARGGFSPDRRFVLASHKSLVGWIVARHANYFVILWGSALDAQMELVSGETLQTWKRFMYFQAAQDGLTSSEKLIP